MQYLESRVEELSHQLDASHMEVRSLQSQQISTKVSEVAENRDLDNTRGQNHVNGSTFQESSIMPFLPVESNTGATVIQNLDLGLGTCSRLFKPDCGYSMN